MSSVNSQTRSLSRRQRLLLEELVRRGLSVPRPQAGPTLSFREYVDKVRPGYRWFKHCIVLAAVLQRVADGELKRVMIFMPPRHGKSELASRLFPAYFLYRHSERWVGLCSYGASLAHTLSRNAQENYLAGGGKVKDDASAVKHWETPEGGGMWATGVGGGILGKGWHLGVIDDPIKNEIEAASLKVQARNEDWYNSTFYTREEPDRFDNPDGALVVIQQRWHDRDLAGWLLSQESEIEEPERWHVVCFDAIKDAEPPKIPETCTLEPDWREPGEALCPERRPLTKLRQIWARIGDYFWNTLFQQRPTPREGAMFQPGFFKVVDAVPAKFVSLVRYWDKAGAGPGRGDWTVGALIGRCADGYYWILDVHRGQWTADIRNNEMLAVAEMDRQKYGRVSIYIEQPPGLAKESTDAVIKVLAGFAALADPARGDKPSRAEPFSAQCRAGNVRMLRAKWNRSYLAVMSAFPSGAHDDDVDASSGAFNKLAKTGTVKFF
jgi:predicted phage terminase large subunit-like protein